MNRTILHSDLNNFYASVECLYRPELREKPVAVGGDPEHRHGIVLAKNQIAKKYGVTTGEALWQAKQKCRDIVFVPPNYKRYLRYSKMAHEIYSSYTDKIEDFGLDECWLDVTGSRNLFGDGRQIADEIRERIKFEMGVSASVGVSFNKIFAKLGSDMKKPDATTVITPEDFKGKVWPLPVSDLLYVGRATTNKLRRYYINTIGDLAKTDINILKSWLGKNGVMLWNFANGFDTSPVTNIGAKSLIKSVGNSTTTPKDLVTDDEVKITIFVLAESVAMRLREHGFKCRTVQITVRNNRLESYERQGKLPFPLCTSTEIADKAFELYKRNHTSGIPIRSFGVRACDLVYEEVTQLSLYPELAGNERREALERAVDNLRGRFGNFIIQRGIMLADKDLSAVNPKDDHIIHPVGFTL